MLCILFQKGTLSQVNYIVTLSQVNHTMTPGIDTDGSVMIKSDSLRRFADVAQLVERRTRNA